MFRGVYFLVLFPSIMGKEKPLKTKTKQNKTKQKPSGNKYLNLNEFPLR